MSRKNLLDIVQERPGDEFSELKELVDNYIANKAKCDEIESQVKQENNKIKEIFKENNLTEYSGDNGMVKMSTTTKETFDEESLITFLKSNGHNDIVKIKEYVDYDALEYAIYHEHISSDEIKRMDNFKIKKTTLVLRIKKKGD